MQAIGYRVLQQFHPLDENGIQNNMLKLEGNHHTFAQILTYSVHCCNWDPSAMLLLRKIKHWNDTRLLVVAWVMRQNFLDLEHYNWKLVQIITNLKCDK
jgi:hypothetical protein